MLITISPLSRCLTRGVSGGTTYSEAIIKVGLGGGQRRGRSWGELTVTGAGFTYPGLSWVSSLVVPAVFRQMVGSTTCGLASLPSQQPEAVFVLSLRMDSAISISHGFYHPGLLRRASVKCPGEPSSLRFRGWNTSQAHPKHTDI